MKGIKQGSVWTFRGHGGGQGLNHLVTMATVKEVVTRSEPCGFSAAPKNYIAGYSWLGTPADFREQFQPAV